MSAGQAGLVEHLVLDQLAAQVLDRVDGLPGLFLLPGAVLVARVGERVAVVAVGGGLDQDRALAGAAELGRPADGVAHRQHVHAVDDFGVHVVVGEADAAPRQCSHAHDLVVGAVGHAVVVVLDDVDDRQTEGLVAGEVVRPLVLAAQLSDSSTTPLA